MMVSLTAAFRVCAATAPMFCIKAPTLVGSWAQQKSGLTSVREN